MGYKVENEFIFQIFLKSDKIAIYEKYYSNFERTLLKNDNKTCYIEIKHFAGFLIRKKIVAEKTLNHTI